jgi:hypothetical protein
VYVKVNDEPLAGVTVNVLAAELPPLVMVPPFPLSEIVTLYAPLNAGPARVTVKALDTANRFPLLGPLLKDSAGALAV